MVKLMLGKNNRFEKVIFREHIPIFRTSASRLPKAQATRFVVGERLSRSHRGHVAQLPCTPLENSSGMPPTLGKSR